VRRNPTLTAGAGIAADELAPRAFLFRVLDCQRLVAPAWRHLLEGLDEVLIGRGDERPRRSEARLHLAVPDPYVSTVHATLTRAGGRWRLTDSSKNGTLVNGARASDTPLGDGDTVEVGGTFFLFRETLPAPPDVAPDLSSAELEPAVPGLATLLPAVEQTFQQLGRVARSPLAIVLRGETGTGKEVLARAIHQLSGRRGPFVGVNCGALPDSLIESELFGARKGAYSGAVEDRPGLVRSADGGTLLLDEVGDLPIHSQAAFLRVLQERVVTPLGGTRAIPVDVRIIAASHHDLRALVARERFRADLEARLSGIELDVPPLRARREDLGLLAGDILRRTLPELARDAVLDRAAARALLRHDWPKNIRELQQALTAAVVLAAGLPVGLQHLPPVFRAPEDGDGATATTDLELRRTVVATLEEEKGNVSGVARALGKPRKQVQRWLKRFGLDPAHYRKPRRRLPRRVHAARPGG
jgi:transcriptional regulator with AAA-type ATPase domain